MTSKTTAGVLLVDKPAGVTSHDVVADIRRRIAVRRVGHAGTLDPFATGLLVVGVGAATRLLDYTHALTKTYEAELTFGAESSTDDLTGTLSPRSFSQPTRVEVEAALRTFIGTYQQLPPRYAAIKVRGKKLYEYARAGEDVPRTPRPVTITSITVSDYTYPQLALTVSCSRGTYIRALARDIGERLGTGVYLTQLRRIAIGPFVVDAVVSLHDLRADTWQQMMLPADELVAHLPRVILSREQWVKWQQGRAIALENSAPSNQPLAVYASDTELMGIGIYNASRTLLEPKVVLAS